MPVTRRHVLTTALPASAALAACGQTAETPKETSSAAPATVQYWDWAPVWQDLVKGLAETFRTRQPNVTVNWEINATDYWTKLQVAIAGDTAPDSWRMNGPNLPQWSSQALLQDISAYVAKDKDVAANLKAMSPVIADYTKRDGKQWSMPFGQAISGILAYNEDHLRAEGLAMPSELWSQGKWTWTTLQEYAVKLTRRDGSRHGFFVNKAFETGYCPFVYANGGLVFDKEGKKPVINSPEAREAFDLLVEMYTRQLVSPNKAEIAQENAVNRFLNGRLAMLSQGSWEIKDLNLKATAIKWNLVPVPLAPRTKRNGSTNQMASIAMSKTSKHKDAVWLWQKYIGSKEGQDVIARAEFFPARVDSAEQVYYDTKLGPSNRPLMRDVLKVTQPMPFVNVGGKTVDWNPVASPLIDQIVDGTLSVKDGLQQVQDQLTALLAS